MRAAREHACMHSCTPRPWPRARVWVALRHAGMIGWPGPPPLPLHVCPVDMGLCEQHLPPSLCNTPARRRQTMRTASRWTSFAAAAAARSPCRTSSMSTAPPTSWRSAHRSRRSHGLRRAPPRPAARYAWSPVSCDMLTSQGPGPGIRDGRRVLCVRWLSCTFGVQRAACISLRTSLQRLP